MEISDIFSKLWGFFPTNCQYQKYRFRKFSKFFSSKYNKTWMVGVSKVQKKFGGGAVHI